MEEYYQKVIQLQERLRQSEEERLKLEMKFNEMLQVMKEEEEVHFKKLRSKYKQFLGEDRQRQQRNDKILEALDRIENRAQIWEAKTEKFKVFRRKYHDYLKHASGRRSKSPGDFERTAEPKYESYEHTVYPDPNQKRDFSEPKSEIMDKYLQSISSQRCKDDVLQQNSVKPSPESKYSNLGNINSIYWKPSKSGEKSDQEKANEFDSVQIKTNKDMENALKQNNASENCYSDFVGRFTDKENYDAEKNLYEKYLPESKFSINPGIKSYEYPTSSTNQSSLKNVMPSNTSRPFGDDPRQGKALRVHNELENMLQQHKSEAQTAPFQPMKTEPLKDFRPIPKQEIGSVPKEQIRRTSQMLPLNQFEQSRNVLKDDQPMTKNQDVSYNQPLDGGSLSRQPEMPAQRRLSSISKTECDDIKSLISNEKPIKSITENLEAERKELPQEKIDTTRNELPPPSDVQRNRAEDNCDVLEIQKNEPTVDINTRPLRGSVDIRPSEDTMHSQQKYIKNGESLPQYDDNSQLVAQYKENGQQLYDENGQPLQKYDAKGQVVQRYYANDEQGQYDVGDQPVTNYDESGQSVSQYDQENQPVEKFDENRQPLQQYDENDQLVQQYDQNGEHLQQYDENGQPMPQYNENVQNAIEYDANGQLIPQYDQNGQPILQYNENGQPNTQFSEYAQPTEQYDENGQPIPQYDENGQPITQYDANGQPLLGYDPNLQVQYDENGQPIPQYDENGQPIVQYDQTGQPLTQYDANGQPIVQYDQTGQPLTQYDENGQPIVQYDQTGQPLTQYDENGQPIVQYNQTGQPLTQYDENGQPIVQYDQTGQPLTQYDENGQPIVQYDQTGQPLTQYDENGQPLQQYYDENGQPVQYYAEGGESVQQYVKNGQPIQQQYDENRQPIEQLYDEHGPPIQQQYGEDQQQYYEEKPQQQPETARKTNVLDILETDTESTKQDTKVSNESDFDFSNG